VHFYNLTTTSRKEKPIPSQILYFSSSTLVYLDPGIRTLAFGMMQQVFIIIIHILEGKRSIQAISSITQTWLYKSVLGHDLIDHTDSHKNIRVRFPDFVQTLSTRYSTDDMNRGNAPLPIRSKQKNQTNNR
jgi:hypothetical protein